MIVDPSLARGLTSRDLARWAEAAERNWRDLTAIGEHALDLQDAGRPPAKVVNRVVKELRGFFARGDVLGDLMSFPARKYFFVFFLPQLSQEGLRFSVVIGSLDGRRNITPLDVVPIATSSRHSLERLHQRIGTMKADDVLAEIYSALGAVQKMRQAAAEIGAPHFPLLGTRGLFVAAPAASAGCTLITWMRYDQLGKRWGAVVHDLRQVPELEKMFVFNSDLCAAALARHEWLKQPHSPGTDAEAEWWTQPRD